MIKRKIQGFTMYLEPSEGGLSAKLAKRQDRGEHCFMWILKTEATGELALDVGGNIGYTTLPICARAVRVMAFEPDGRTRCLLVKNVRANGFEPTTVIYDCAISDKGGSSLFYLGKKPNQSTLCDVLEPHRQEGTCTVETRTIDSFDILPNFIKMDIEGSEVEALNGAMQSLEKTPYCKLLIEIHPQFFKGDSFELVLRRLVTMGYHFKYVVSAGVERPDLFRQHGYEPLAGAPKCMDKKGIKPKRAIYDCLSTEHAIKWSSYRIEQKYPGGISPKIIRSILLVKE